MNSEDDDFYAALYAAEDADADGSAEPVPPRVDESPLTASVDCVNAADGRLKVRYPNRTAAADRAALKAPGLVAYLCNRPPMHGRRAGCGYWHFGHASMYN